MKRIEKLLELCRGEEFEPKTGDPVVKEVSMKRLLREITSLDKNLDDEDFLMERADYIHLWVEASLRVIGLIDKYNEMDFSLYTTRLQKIIDRLYMLIELLSESERYYRPHLVYAIGTCEFYLFQLRMKYDLCFDQNIFLTSLRVCLGNLRQELNDFHELIGMKYPYAKDFIEPKTFELFEKSIKPWMKESSGGVTIRKKSK